MSIKKLFLASSSALVLTAATALADNNESFLVQTGDRNQGLIDQSAATNSSAGQASELDSVAQSGNGNNLEAIQIGDGQIIGSGGRFEQRGNNNRARIIQNGSNNEFVFMDQSAPSSNSVQNSNKLRVRQVGTDNIVKEVRQTQTGGIGTDANDMDIFQQNGTNLRVGGRVTQRGIGNDMDIYQTGSDNTIAPINATPVIQDGDDNTMSLSQSGSGNLLEQAQQIGDDNTTAVDISGTANGTVPLTSGGPSEASMAVASAVDQFGSFNQVDLMITGNSNAYGTLQDGNNNLALGMVVTGDDNSVGVGQFGDDNEIALAMVTGNGNDIGFYQNGDDNFGSIQVDRDNNEALIEQDGNRNEAYLEVSGQRNDATLSVTGDDNYLNGYQRGRSHFMSVDIVGDGNNSASAPAFSGAALTASNFVTGSGLLKSASFGAGDLFQLESGGSGGDNRQRNSLTITGTNADNNAFAMYQNGSENSTTGTISGSMNQAVVGQIGNDNSATFAQAGSGNIAGIMQ